MYKFYVVTLLGFLTIRIVRPITMNIIIHAIAYLYHRTLCPKYHTIPPHVSGHKNVAKRSDNA